jgi:hypothetical protein
MPQVPPATWTANAEGCGFTGTVTTCGSNELCVPSPSTPFHLCIYQPASSLQTNCPAPYDSTILPVVIDTSITDTRTCTDCACGDPASTCTGGSLLLSPNAGTCGGGIQSQNPTTCMIDGIPSALPLYTKLLNAPTAAGTCTPQGGLPTGSATGSNPVAVCCMP